MDAFSVFEEITWYRLRAVLRQTRVSARMKAHPLSVFNAIVKSVSSAVDTDGGEPIVFFHAPNGYAPREDGGTAVDILFALCSREYAEVWSEALRLYLADPELGANFELLEVAPIEERAPKALFAESAFAKTSGEICLEFLTPFPFVREKGKPRTFLGRAAFVRAFERRLSRLFGRDIAYEAGTDAFEILPYYWRYHEIRHRSRSERGSTQYINGCAGRLYLKGSFGNFLPFLILGSELHTGNKIGNSQGYYRLLDDSPAFFESRLDDSVALASTVAETLDNYDGALDELTKREGFVFDEKAFAETLLAGMRDGSYVFKPNRAFSVAKKDGSSRLLERPTVGDLIVLRRLARILAPVVESAFEESSIGFRKGSSRFRAVDTIRRAVAEGYTHIVESDVENFFPSVDHDTLRNLVGAILPEKDKPIRDLVFRAIGVGYVQDGAVVERKRGIAEGSPLSPLLANLYLDAFDERMKESGVRLVRYADDFLLCAKSRDDACRALETARSVLKKQGLSLKDSKTSIRDIGESFEFLGIRFAGGEADIEADAEAVTQTLKKPLYCMEPYVFLSASGDMIEVRRGNSILLVIPFRRVSEIIVMGHSSFSSILLRRCVAFGIPVAVALESGYYVALFRPDSKRFYDIAARHAERYANLAPSENLAAAQVIACNKIRSYLPFFRQKLSGAAYTAIRDRIECAAVSIAAARDVAAVRGAEGAVARAVYESFNACIRDPLFHIKGRRRKNPDRINSLLNFSYYLLFSAINTTVRAVGLNPYLGFLHSGTDNYESLVCDIEELFRARIARLIVRSLNLKTIGPDDFRETEKGFFLNHDAARRVVEAFAEEMDTIAEGDTLTLKAEIHAQAMILKRWAETRAPMTFFEWKF